MYRFRRRARFALLLALTSGGLLSGGWLQRQAEVATLTGRLAHLEQLTASATMARCPVPLPGPSPNLQGLQGRLASWQTVGGCGAGASTGTGGGVKWIGRYVRGGLFNLECQANYVATPYGYNFVGNSLVTHELTTRWSVGASVPYLYKYMRDPYAVGVDLANKGAGDVTLLLTRKFGDTNNWISTVGVGLPTGTHDVRFRTELLPQDRQLGLGKPTAMLMLDHVDDHLWGVTVLGGTASWRGATNDEGSSRAPTASLYAYAGYLLGPFVPALGVSATGFFGNDQDRLQEQPMPVVSLAANASLEWSTDWMAVLLAASAPADLWVHNSIVDPYHRQGAWVLALGMAFAMF